MTIYETAGRVSYLLSDANHVTDVVVIALPKFAITNNHLR